MIKMLAAIGVALCVTAATAQAQTEDTIQTTGTAGPYDRYEEPRRTLGFVEGNFGYGFQFGTTSYVPTDDGPRHPLTNGYAAGATAGIEVVPMIALLASYSYTAANSRNGEVANAIDDINGSITYHTITVGGRIMHRLGIGRLYGELGAGVVLPFETELEYQYNERLALLPAPITGTGTKTDEYNLGYGAHAVLGYQIDLMERLYLGFGAKVETFASSNDGESTRYDNFIVDATTIPPAAVSATTDYGTDTENRPQTYSVQSLRFMLSLGGRI